MTTSQAEKDLRRALNGLAFVVGKTDNYQIAETISDSIIQSKYSTDLTGFLENHPVREQRDLTAVVKEIVFLVATGDSLESALESQGIQL
jgi:hypothetical protein